MDTTSKFDAAKMILFFVMNNPPEPLLANI